MFYTVKKELDDETVEKIMNDQQAKKDKRMREFTEFADAIESQESAESIIKKRLNIS